MRLGRDQVHEIDRGEHDQAGDEDQVCRQDPGVVIDDDEAAPQRRDDRGEGSRAPRGHDAAAARMTSSGGFWPVKSSNAIAPWWTSMPSPFAAPAPAASAAATSGVSPG